MRALVLRACDRAGADRVWALSWLVGWRRRRAARVVASNQRVRALSPRWSSCCFSLFAQRERAAKRLRGTMSSAKDRNKAKAEVRSVLAMRGALSAFSHARVAVHRRTMRSSGESVSDESSRRRRSWRACGARSRGWIRRGMARSM